jgi:hypothetical protein
MRAAWAAAGILLLFGLHFREVCRNAVDVPFWDDWAVLDRQALPSGVSWSWLYARHNESRKIPTKLQIWALYRLTDWNLSVHQILNFLLYGAVLAVLSLLARRIGPGLSPPVWCAFLAFLLSVESFENHLWAINSCIHFAVLFFLLAVYFLFREPLRPALAALGAACAVLCVNSFSAGPPLCAGLLLALVAWKRRLTPAAGVVALAIVAWAADFKTPAHHAPALSPLRPEVWTFLANVAGTGFGVDGFSSALGVLALAAPLVPLAGLLRARGSRGQPATWALAAGVAGVLASLLAIAMGRAPMGLEGSKAPRYAELSMLLVPFSALGWHLLLKDRPSERRLALGLLWLACFVGFLDDWDLRVYRIVGAQRREGVRCIEDYYRRGGPALCPTLFDEPLAERLDNARALGLSFARKATR